MKYDYITNSHFYLTYTFGRMYVLNLGVKGLNWEAQAVIQNKR